MSLTGRRNEVGWRLDLGVNPVDAHAPSALAIRLEAVLTAGRAFVTLEMAVSARETAGARARRFGRLALGLGGRRVACIWLLDVVL